MQRQFNSLKSGSGFGSGHFRFLVICRQSFRHGSREGQEDNHLVHTTGQTTGRIRDRHVTDADHIIIRRSKEVQWNLHLKEGAEVNMFAHDQSTQEAHCCQRNHQVCSSM